MFFVDIEYNKAPTGSFHELSYILAETPASYFRIKPC